jgi:hypothetical protein
MKEIDTTTFNPLEMLLSHPEFREGVDWKTSR